MNHHSWLYKQFHSSYAIGWMCTGLLVGLGLSRLIYMPVDAWIMGVMCIVMAAPFASRRWYALLGITCIAVVIGMMRGTATQHDLSTIQSMQDKQVLVRGVLSEDPEISPRGDTRISLTHIAINDEAMDGDIWLTLRGEHTDISRGDSITLNGTTKPGFGSYQLTMLYPTLVSHVASGDPMVAFRDQFVRAVRTAVVEPAASLGVGFVVGQKTALPPTLEEQLRIVGLTHLIVASGYNLTILVRAAKRLFEKRSKYLVAFSSSILIVGFIAISGASPSMNRAGIVAGLSLLAWYFGRAFHPFLLLVYVAAATAMINPMYLWADVGWWLSFLAFAGILIIAPLMTRLIMRERKLSGIVQIVVETIAAQIMTLPIILMVFGNLPVLAIVANVLTAPLIPFVMLLTFIAGIGAMIVPALATIVGLPAEILLSYFVAIVRWLASPSWAQQLLTISADVMVAVYLMLIAAFLVIWRHTKFNFRSQNIIE
ncbi:MAG: ComEC/Rec2 family competence protein [Candidatus Saccharimonadales bacterium]